MKRVLQALALVQLLLVVGLAVRVVSVWTTPLPEFSELPELPAPAPLPPAKPVAKVSETVTTAIVEHDLFDDQRGQGKSDNLEGLVVESAPVPPPSTVKLMGVMILGKEPVAILHDTNVKPEQQSVRKGDMFGEYEIGAITVSGLTLLGGGGQQFQIPLRVEAAGVAAVATAPAPRPAGGAARPAPAAGRPVATRPVPQRNAPADEEGAPDKAMSARERAQAIAQRNAELRKTGGQHGAQPGAAGEKEPAAPDPVQARLEALRQLREAAKGR